MRLSKTWFVILNFSIDERSFEISSKSSDKNLDATLWNMWERNLEKVFNIQKIELDINPLVCCLTFIIEILQLAFFGNPRE